VTTTPIFSPERARRDSEDPRLIVDASTVRGEPQLALALHAPVGLAAGIIGGGILGAVHHKGLGLDKADRDRIAAELGDGKAAVGVLAPADEAVAVLAGLTALGGAAESHEVADEDLEEAHAATAADSS
jgi:hypothetical protein